MLSWCAGLDAAGDIWEPLINLTNCKAAFPPPLIPPVRFTVEAAPPSNLRVGAALVGRTALYWLSDDGWQCGTVARLCPRGAFSHVVAFASRTSVLPARRTRSY